MIIIPNKKGTMNETKKLMEEIGTTYKFAKGIENLDIDRFFKSIFEKRTEIPVTINKNPALAKQVRERIMGYFE